MKMVKHLNGIAIIQSLDFSINGNTEDYYTNTNLILDDDIVVSYKNITWIHTRSATRFRDS